MVRARKSFSLGRLTKQCTDCCQGTTTRRSSLYFSWETQEFDKYGADEIIGFEQTWDGDINTLEVIDMPSEAYEELASLYRGKALPRFFEADEIVEPEELSLRPKLPRSIKGTTYSLFTHQQESLRQWQKEGCRGIFALCTGAGKTITALHAAVQAAQAHFNKNRSFALIVAVPYPGFG